MKVQKSQIFHLKFRKILNKDLQLGFLQQNQRTKTLEHLMDYCFGIFKEVQTQKQFWNNIDEAKQEEGNVIGCVLSWKWLPINNT